MKYSYNMPYQREAESSGANSIDTLKLYKPLPDKSGLEVYNEVFIPLFSPTKWKLFNPTPEQSQKYGIVGGSSRASSLVSIPPDLATFYFKLPTHRINNYNRPDGTVGFSHVICPIKMNEYLVKYLGFGPMFENPKCADCEKEQEWWDSHNDRWAALGYTDELKKGLSKEEYRKLVEGDMILKQTRAMARDCQVSDRYILNVFDHDKFMGNRAMDEGQTSLGYQVWMAPKSIFDGLIDIYKVNKDSVDQGLDVPFFDTSSPNGLHILSIKKDTTECVGNNLQKTKYRVISGRKHVYPPEWIEYLNNFDAMVDPSDFVFIPNYADRKASFESENSSPRASNNQPQPNMNQNMPMNMGQEFRASVPTPPAFSQQQPVNQGVQHPMGMNVPPTPNSFVRSPMPPIPQPPTQSQPTPVSSSIQNMSPMPPIPPPPTQSQVVPPIPTTIPGVGGAPSGMPPVVTPNRTPPGGSPPPARRHSW